MRLFFVEWADEHPELADLVEDLQKEGNQIVYWSRASDDYSVDRSRFPDTVFHDYYDAVAGIPAPEFAEFTPPGEALLVALYECESTLLTMMNKKYYWMTIDERKHLYYRMVSYWDSVLNKTKPDLIVFPFPPHMLYDYVIYSLAHYYGIPTRMYFMTVIGDRHMYLNDYRLGSLALKAEVELLKSTDVSEDDLSPDIRAYYRKETAPDADKPPLYQKEMHAGFTRGKRLFAKAGLVVRSIRDGSIFERGTGYILKKFRPSLKDEHEKVQKPAELDKPFVYCALHLQPEATTSPQGGVYVDQLLMIETLSKALPEGWELYVKEHPTQWLPGGTNFTNYRYSGYYDSIAKLHNVRLVPIKTSTFSLIRSCRAVATVTGTAIWEGLLRGKPGVYFGYPWYAYAPGTHRAHDVVSAESALKAIQAHPQVSKQDVLKFLLAFDRSSIKGYLDRYCRSISALTTDENKSNIRSVIESRMKEIAKHKNS